MRTSALTWLARSVGVFMVVVFAACAAETPVGLSSPSTGPTLSRVDLGICEDLRPPAGSTILYHVYARGVQIYRWNGTSWGLVGPDAQLFADQGEHGLVGSHYAGPTWETLSGSKVVGAVAKRCTFDPTAVQWLQLTATSTQGPGVFDKVKYILRVNTMGGIAPSSPGTTGQEVSVPYSTEYFFYRGK